MNKQKFGKLFYYGTLIITIVIVVASLFIFQSDGSEEMNNYMSVLRYMTTYYSFTVIVFSSICVEVLLAISGHCHSKARVKKK